MTALTHAIATYQTPSIDMLVKAIDAPAFTQTLDDPDCAMPNEALTYRSSPDGSVTIGTDPNSGQAVLIIANAKGHWEVALPKAVEHYVTNAAQTSFAGAKRLAEAAFAAHFQLTQR